ncbi:MAG: substrate-binding domain-containing protein [Oscillospiraceae bacterium]
MKKYLSFLIAILLFSTILFSGCEKSNKNVKIGVSFGVGEAVRWVSEKEYMENHAKELGAEIEVRLNKTDKPKTQQQDCFEMIDSGIDVLILTPRDATKVKEILDYAKQKNVYVINYSRVVTGETVDLFVGYDSGRLGQRLGQFITEMVDKGDYIILSGPENDNNAKLIYDGAMAYINPIKSNINILLDASVPNWSVDEAKTMVFNAIKANNNKIDAILAPNDKLAGACVQALKDLGVTSNVVITGMDAELEALKRIAAGTQSATIQMDIKELAETAINEAVNLATNKPINVNATFDNSTEKGIQANLITGQLVIKQNIDKIFIESGNFTHEEIYGTSQQ